MIRKSMWYRFRIYNNTDDALNKLQLGFKLFIDQRYG